MATRVRSYSKINLGLAIGPVRADGFHGLVTLYQTLALHDVVTVTATSGSGWRRRGLSLTTNHPRVPMDGRNTAWKMVELALGRMGVAAEVEIHIEKGLPVQGGLGAGSANAAAALIGLERELGVALRGGWSGWSWRRRWGRMCRCFWWAGRCWGRGGGRWWRRCRICRRRACVVAVPEVGVSTPRAFREWDADGQRRGQVGVCRR